MNRAETLENLERWQEALDSINHALDVTPEIAHSWPAWTMRGYCHGKLGQHEQALEAYQRALLEQPEDAKAWNGLSCVFQEQNSYDEALAAVDRAIALDEAEWAYASNRAGVLFALKRYDEALVGYERSAELKPDEAEIRYWKGRTLRELKRDEEALAAFDQALVCDPDDADAADWRADTIYTLGRYEEALAAYERAIGLTPDQTYQWYWKGWSLRKLGRDEEALAAFEQAAELDPKDGDAANQCAAALFRLKRYEEAVAAYDQTLELKPKDSGVWYWKGRALFELRREQEALTAYEHAELLGLNDYAIHMGSSRAFANLGRYDEALVEIVRALKHDPTNYEALSHRAWTCSEVGRYDEALTTYMRILELKPDDLWARRGRGHELYHLNRYEEALAAYEAALEISPEDPNSLRMKVGALDHLGRYDEALSACDATLAIAPDDREVRATRAWLALRQKRDIPDQRLTLPDGRTLGYLDVGDPYGYPLFYFHGVPGSRLEIIHYTETLKELHIRLIAPDRPGYGLSTDHPRRRILDWPDDVATLADHLGIARFAVFGVSGGGPYAMVCAHKLPERLTALGLLSSSAPPAAVKGHGQLAPWYIAWWIARHIPMAVAKQNSARLARATTNSVELYNALVQFRDEGRLREAFFRMRDSQNSRSPLTPTEREIALESWKQQGTGHARDAWLQTRDWGFPLEDITAPTYLWHGELDNLAPIAFGRYLATRIPNCQATYYPNERHGLLATHAREIFSALAAESALASYRPE
jgi:tetratricopeptide (TPR) repeat protein